METHMFLEVLHHLHYLVYSGVRKVTSIQNLFKIKL